MKVWLDKSKDVDSEASVEQQETKQKTDCCRVKIILFY